MPRTPIGAFGKLEMKYSAFGKPHVFRVYVPEFGTDPTVGTFTAVASPVSLDALATELTAVIGPLYEVAAGLSFGEWIGLKHTSGESFIPINNGTITPGTYTPAANVANQPGPVTQATWDFRDTVGALIRHEQLGCQYVDSSVFRYGGLGGSFLAYANYVLGSVRIVSRAGNSPGAMVSLTFDTNDGLTRRYRR